MGQALAMRPRARLVLALCLLAAVPGCSKGRGPGRTGNSLGARRDRAERPRPASGREAPGALPAQQGVEFVYVQRERGGAGILSGGVSKATIALDRNPAREVDVTIAEECPGCAGSAWSSSIWMAAFLATSLHGHYLADYKFSVRARGFIDGPSAGALLAATMLAMLDGAPIRPRVVITGALNPDLSIGPVGGIPQKLIAAVKAGKETFCYPAPQGSVWDDNFHATVEVQQLAQRQGISARPVRDLREAYECLTGRALARAERIVDAEAMKDSFGQMRALTDSWLARSRAAFEELRATPGRERFTPWVALVRKSHDAAEKDLKLQRVPVAHARAMQAAAGFEVLLLAARAADAKKGGDVRKLLSSLEPLAQVEGELKALEQQMAVSKLNSVGNVLNLVWAHGAAAQSHGYLEAARQAPQSVQDRKVQLLFSAKLALEQAKDVWNSWKDEKVQNELRLDNKEVGALAHSYLSAATAGFQYYRALARELPAQAQAQADQDIDPEVVLRQLGYAAERLQDESLAGALAALGASIQSYVDASYLMASGYLRQFYEMNDQLKARAGKPAAPGTATSTSTASPWMTYTDLLEYAERRARESATRAQEALSAIPSVARFHYLAGRDELIYGDEQEKQRSIYDFWSSSAFSDLAVQLAAGPRALMAGAAR